MTLEDIRRREMTFARNKGRVFTELDGETVILDIASGVYSSINEVGTLIWNMLEMPTTFNALMEGIMAEYDVSEEQCGYDLAVFLDDMIRHGLIVPGDEKTC